MGLEGKFYGGNKRIYLKPQEYETLVKKYGEETIKDLIVKMDEYMELTGKRYKKYVLALNNWARREIEQGNKKVQRKASENKALSDYERYKRENNIE